MTSKPKKKNSKQMHLNTEYIDLCADCGHIWPYGDEGDCPKCDSDHWLMVTLAGFQALYRNLNVLSALLHMGIDPKIAAERAPDFPH